MELTQNEPSAVRQGTEQFDELVKGGHKKTPTRERGRRKGSGSSDAFCARPDHSVLDTEKVTFESQLPSQPPLISVLEYITARSSPTTLLPRLTAQSL